MGNPYVMFVQSGTNYLFPTPSLAMVGGDSIISSGGDCFD